MSASGNWPDNSFWDFSLTLYGRDGVPDMCLDLQDKLGADVNVLFYCCWLAVRGAPAMTDQQVAEIDQAVRDWREQVVKPLRQIRRDLKENDYPGDHAIRENIRNQVKRTELDAEHAQQLMLAALIPVGPGSPENSEALRDTAVANMGLYLAHVSGAATDEDLATLVRISQALDTSTNILNYLREFQVV